MVLDKNWQSFQAANLAYQETPSKFNGRPKLPKYKNKDTLNIPFQELKVPK
jgi:hypothetical protein